MAFPNVYMHRKVAETSAKPCDICFKPSSSVLITSDNKDWFYVCPIHLKDPGFCTPKIDQAAIEARKKRELEEEIERVKKEYEEKQRKKKEKNKDKAGNDEKKDEAGDKNTDNKTAEDTANSDGKGGSTATEETGDELSSAVGEEEPRIFELKSAFYQQRLNRKRQAEIAKRNRERMNDPNFLPSVPKNLPS
ncbi:hypothetical protein VTK26DRAFT_5036 [Humicola hyalothermophila]